jgi:hypothetical protein
MNRKENPAEASEFLDKLIDFLAYPDEEENVEQLRLRLIAQGLDPDGTWQRVQKIIELKKKEKRLSWQKSAVEKSSQMKKRLSGIARNIVGTRDELIERVQNLVSKKPTHAFFRNITMNEMGDEELRSLVASLTFTDEEIDNEEKDSEDERQ